MEGGFEREPDLEAVAVAFDLNWAFLGGQWSRSGAFLDLNGLRRGLGFVGDAEPWPHAQKQQKNSEGREAEAHRVKRI